MSTTQKQHKISPAIAWLTIQKFIIFYCPLDREHTKTDCIPDNTPYLKMKLGTVGLIPYEKPGTPELFAAFRERMNASDGYLLKAHGPVVPGKSIMDAFYCLEELEESAHIAWELNRSGYR